MAKQQMRSQRNTELFAILMNGERYGLDIRKEYQKRFGKELPLGSLYVTLDRMEDKGWLKSRMGESGPDRRGRRRKYYRTTASGKRSFDAAAVIQMSVFGGLING